MSSLLAVDICGTLYDENTTAGFVRFHANRTGHRPALFRLLETLRRTPLRTPVIALGKLTGTDLFRTGYIRCLSGQSRTTLTDSATAYAAHLDRLSINPAHTRMAQMQAQGWQVTLASNSLDIVVAAIAQRLNLPYVASTLGFAGDTCTGRLTTDLKGRKWAALAPQSPTKFAVITDNRSDRDLITRADPAILVAKSAPKPWMSTHPHAEILHHSA